MTATLSPMISPNAITYALIFMGVLIAAVIGMFLFDYLKKNFRQIFKFALIGGSGVIINSAVIYAMTEWVHLYYMISNLFAIAVASVWNYLWYKYWVFNDGTKKGHTDNVQKGKSKKV
jgi:prolipoprotein diacylglyceryltransferase